MKARDLKVACLLGSALVLLAGCGEPETEERELGEGAQALISPSEPMHVMTVNARQPSDPGELSWERRLPRIVSMIRTYDYGRGPHVIGVQELDGSKLSDLQSRMGGYQSVWVKPPEKVIERREGNYLAIFVRSDTLEVLDYGSKGTMRTDRDDLCDVTGNERDHQWRGIHYAHLRERATGRAFYFYNTHFPSKHSCERKQMAKIVDAFIDGRASKNDPVILVGDFNDGVKTDGGWNDSYRRVVEYTGLVDSYGVTNNLGAGGAFASALPDWRVDVRVGRKIDHVFVAPSFGVVSSGIDRLLFTVDGWPVYCPTPNGSCGSFRLDQLYPYSDHWAVWASVHFR